MEVYLYDFMRCLVVVRKYSIFVFFIICFVINCLGGVRNTMEAKERSKVFSIIIIISLLYRV